MCPSSLLAVICFLQVLAFSFCSASAGRPLSLDGNTETRTMFLEDKNKNTCSRCGMVLGTMGKRVRLWFFSAGSVRYRWLTPEVRGAALSPRLCGWRNGQPFRSDQRNFLSGAPLVGAKCLSLNKEKPLFKHPLTVLPAAQCCPFPAVPIVMAMACSVLKGEEATQTYKRAARCGG